MAVADLESPPLVVERPDGRRWLIAAVLLVAILAAFFDRISIAILFTNVTFQTDMGIGFNPAKLGLLMTVFVFAYGASGLILSFVGDLYAPRRSLAIGAAVWGVAMAAMGATSGFSTMLALRLVLGLAEGPQYSLTNALIKRWFAPREQARASSIWMVGSPLGSAIGFPLTVFIVAHFGWRASFYSLAALNLIIVLPLIVFALRDEPVHPLAVASPAAAAAPFRTQVALFIRDRRFWLATLFGSAALVYLWGLNSWLPTYLAQVRHLDMREVGNYSFLSFFAMFLGMIGSAALSDRLGKRAILSFVGLFCAGVSMYFVSILEDPTTAAAALALSAFFWGCAMPPVLATLLSILPVGAMSTGVGVYNGIGNLVGAFSPLAMGILIGYFGFGAGLWVLIGATLVGSFAILPLARDR